MTILSFGYMGVATKALSDWASLARDMMGLQVIDHSRNSLSLRMDDKKQRLFIDEALPAGSRVFGWEVDGPEALNCLAAQLEDAGVRVNREPTGVADQRFVRELISFFDPSGNRLEAFYGQDIASEPFRPGRTISGFRTGPLGLGHVALNVEDLGTTYPFYRDLLGFKLSDFILRPFRANFLHINARHHSVALIETGRNGVHHVMFELYSLDDVGQGYDIALTKPDQVSVTLGRHCNDLMTSFYVNTPSNFLVEYGWGGRDVVVGAIEPVELVDGPSLWGHERSWLSEEAREEALRMRLAAAAKGVRAPVQVLDGNFQKSRGACPWWGSLNK